MGVAPYRGGIPPVHGGATLVKGTIMPVFSVDTQAVADTAYRTRARISTIQTEVDAMNSDIATLQSSWTGAAADSMAVCATDWSTVQAQVQTSLDAISLALDQAAVSYDDAEAANTTRFGR